MSHTSPTLYSRLITTVSVANILEVGDIINGIGIPIDSEVLEINNLGNSQWGIVIDQTPLEADVYATGSHGPYTDPSGAAGNRVSWSTNITIERPTKVSPTISFNEKVKGWVSLKSFGSMQMGISLANNYYTFHEGKLFLHYSETQNRNTFYGVFTPSSIDVVLNQNPGVVKVFNTLNYEGSQAKVDAFTSKEIDGTTYNDQEYYNLYDKKGWSVESIITNKEEGKVNEFIEKEGKWFNGISKIVDVSAKAETSDFTFQGIGVIKKSAIDDDYVVSGGGVSIGNDNILTGLGGGGGGSNDDDDQVFGCTNPTANNYNPLATDDDGSCAFDIAGCTNPKATNYNPLAVVDDGSCIIPSVDDESDDRIFGCTNPNALNYNPLATDDDGSCTLPSPKTTATKGAATKISSTSSDY